jgi:uncharacterized protein
MYLKRTLEEQVRNGSTFFPVVLVTGPRQVGKTTLLRRISEPERVYANLDDPTVLQLAVEEPILFFQRFPPPVLIDEIQYAPSLLKRIKVMVDEDRSPGRFWITGSQQFQMMKGVSESLAGRVCIFELLGLSQRELDHDPSRGPFLPRSYGEIRENHDSNRVELHSVYDRIWRGSFPASLSPEFEWENFYRSYLRTYLQRDVQDLLKVGDLMSFQRFMKAMAARTGQILNMADAARDADISPNTAKSWLSVLVASRIVVLLEPYHANLTKRFVKAPKLYFLDTGLCSYLTSWNSSQSLESGAMTGAFLETWIISEIFKSYCHSGKDFPGYFFRDFDQKEVDLVIHQNGTLYPIEIKKSSQPGKDSIRNFSTLAHFGLPIGPGAVVCLTSLPYPISDHVVALPLTYI